MNKLKKKNNTVHSLTCKLLQFDEMFVFVCIPGNFSLTSLGLIAEMTSNCFAYSLSSFVEKLRKFSVQNVGISSNVNLNSFIFPCSHIII